MTQQIPDMVGYRPCVGIMLLNQKGKVLVAKRVTSPNSSGKLLWQMPQGGIDAGEAPYPAALRELYEETNVSSVSLIAEAPDWLAYDFPKEMAGHPRYGKHRGQKQKWFALRFEGEEAEIDVLSPGEGQFHAEFSAWQWVDMAQLPGLIVPFKRDVYTQLVSIFGHLS